MSDHTISPFAKPVIGTSPVLTRCSGCRTWFDDRYTPPLNPAPPGSRKATSGQRFCAECYLRLFGADEES